MANQEAREIQSAILSPKGGEYYAAFHTAYTDAVREVLRGIDLNAFAQAVDVIAATAGNGQVFTIGNGGTHTIADHTAHNFNWDASGALPPGQKLSARCLTAEAAEITARANDRSFAYGPALQLENHARQGDVLIAYSGSGNSDNVVKTLEQARLLGLKTVFVGPQDSPAARASEITIGLNSPDQQIVEDGMTPVMHLMIRALKVKLGGLPQDALFKDIATQRTRIQGITERAAQLGYPVEVTAFIENGFREGLSELASQKVHHATQQEANLDRRDAININQLGTQFSSFTYDVSYGNTHLAAKVAFGDTMADLMREYARDGVKGLVHILFRSNTDGETQYARNAQLYRLLGDSVAEPQAFIDGVGFYKFVEGQTLYDALANPASIPFRAIGGELRTWHELLTADTVTPEMQAVSSDRYDTLRKFNERFGHNVMERTLKMLFDQNHVGNSNSTLLISLLHSITQLRGSKIFALEPSVWAHGDCQPGNIIIGANNRITFIDNDAHLQAPLLDVAKLISRTIVAGRQHGVPQHEVQQGIQEFLDGYYQGEPIPYELIRDAVAMDLLDTLGKYSYLTKKDVADSPDVIHYVMSHAPEVIQYIDAILSDNTDSVEVLFPNATPLVN